MTITSFLRKYNETRMIDVGIIIVSVAILVARLFVDMIFLHHEQM